MKKFTLLVILLTVSFGYSQTPTTDAPTPTNDPADVISVYSDAYTNVATNYNPGWGQSGSVNTTFDPTGGGTNFVMAYTNFNYQGTEIATQNAAAMEYLHIDIWTANATDVRVSPINSGTGETEFLVPVTLITNNWSSVDIPKSAFVGMTWDAVFQLKFDGQAGQNPSDIYLDNIYFWKAPINPQTDATLSDLQVDASTINAFSPTTYDYTYELPSGTTTVPQITSATPTNANVTSVTITQATTIPGDATVVVVSEDGTVTNTYTVSYVTVGPATAAPTPIARNSWDVISLFSNAYTDIPVSEWSTSWDSASIEDVEVAGNDTKKVTYGDFLGVDFSANSFDASAMERFHIDYYVDENLDGGEVLIPKWSNHTGGAGETNALLYTENVTVAKQWVSLDVALADFTAQGSSAMDNVAQFILGTGATIGSLYFDNLYLYRAPTLSTNDFDLTDFTVYPNPTLNTWTLNSEQIINRIDVYDITGKRVLSQTPLNNQAVIDGVNLEVGIYIAKIQATKGISQIKLIKK